MPLNSALLNKKSYEKKVLGLENIGFPPLPLVIKDQFLDKLVDIAKSDSDLRNFDEEEKLKLLQGKKPPPRGHALFFLPSQ